MDLARFVVDAVVLEGRSYRDVATAHGVSKSWVQKLVARYRDGGYETIAPRSKAAKRIANKSPAELEERVVRLRKELTDEGFDAGPQTIHYHLRFRPAEFEEWLTRNRLAGPDWVKLSELAGGIRRPASPCRAPIAHRHNRDTPEKAT